MKWPFLILNSMFKVYSFSRGKNKNKNEDFFGYNKNSFIVVDGSTDKSGFTYQGMTGGEIISRLVAKESLSCQLNGEDLAIYLNNKVASLYKKMNILDKVKMPKNRFSCGFVLGRISGKNLIITYLGDLGFRINNSYIYKYEKIVDILNSQKRSDYIKKTQDIQGSRKYIIPYILNNFKYQNNPKHKFGYGVIDGTKTPSKFIKVFNYKLSDIKTLEIFTDGYFSLAEKPFINSWEKSFKKVEREDPDKWKKYKSTKSKDDRTILIIKFLY